MDSLSPAKTTPGSRKQSNRRTKDQRYRSGPGSTNGKMNHGEIPGIPQKVVGIVALDVIESYGPVDMSNPNFKSPEHSTPAERHIVAVKETTLYEENSEVQPDPIRTQSRKNSAKAPSGSAV